MIIIEITDEYAAKSLSLPPMEGHGMAESMLLLYGIMATAWRKACSFFME